MDRPSRRGKPPQNRGRGGAGGRPYAPKAAGEKSWSKEKAMGTAKSMVDHGRQKARRAEDDEYLGSPPPGRDLILVSPRSRGTQPQAKAGSNNLPTRVVLPGKHMLPRGLDEPWALDDIRKAHKVYITHVQPNILDIHCESMPRMQQAVHALNWAIHDLRLSNEHPPVRFLLQEPTNSDMNDMVRVEIGSRPRFTSRSSTLVSNSSAMDKHLHRLAVDMPTSADTLMALSKNMRMRVNFGHLDVRSRNTQGRDEITHDEFVKLLNMYSVRGGASLGTKLPEATRAEEVMRYLVNPAQGIYSSHQEITQGCEVTLVTKGLEIKTDAMDPMGKKMQLSMVRAMRSEAWGRLNWTVAAPDMQYDWNLRVDAWDNEEVPVEFKDLSQKLLLTVDSNQAGSDLIRIPHVSTHKLGNVRDSIGQLRLKSSAIIPYKTTPYVIEVNVTKVWKGTCTADTPEITWGIEFYAAHWDESIMHISGGDHRKDWGQGLKHMWPGDEPRLEPRFGEFLGTILEIQALLDGACPI